MKKNLTKVTKFKKSLLATVAILSIVGVSNVNAQSAQTMTFDMGVLLGGSSIPLNSPTVSFASSVSKNVEYQVHDDTLVHHLNSNVAFDFAIYDPSERVTFDSWFNNTSVDVSLKGNVGNLNRVEILNVVAGRNGEVVNADIEIDYALMNPSNVRGNEMPIILENSSINAVGGSGNASLSVRNSSLQSFNDLILLRRETCRV